MIVFALIVAASLAGAAAPAPGAAGPAKGSKIQKTPKKKPAPDAPERPVNITADLFELVPSTQQAVWRGHVKVDRDDATVTCDKLTADYDDQKKIQRMTCVGRAHLAQQARPPKQQEREAWGDLAVWEHQTSTITVTGSPRGREGTSTMEGDKVLVLLDDDRMVVEGNVKMVVDSNEGAPTPKALGDHPQPPEKEKSREAEKP